MIGAGPFFGVLWPGHHRTPARHVDTVTPTPVVRQVTADDQATAEAGQATSDASPAPQDTPTAAPADAQQAPPSPPPGDPPPPPAESEPPPPPPPPPEPLLAHNQMVVFYGSPLSSKLGILGVFEPDDAARRVKDEAAVYDSLNGDRGAVPALDLIYAQVQSAPTENGLYLRYLPDATVQQYLALAEQYDEQLILDLQIGRSSVLAEIQKVEPYLRNPRVHVAIDPEYAVGPDGVPLKTPGRITGDDINAAQDYLEGLIGQYQLPPKMLFIHQYLEGTVLGGETTKVVPDVDLVLNMDAFGNPGEKLKKYQMFAARPYAEHRAFNIFLHYDDHVLSEEEALALDPQPDVIFYQ